MLQHQIGLTAAEYGSVMIIPSAGLMLGSLTLNVLNRFMSTAQILSLAISIMVAAGVWLLVTQTTLFNLVWAFTWLTIAQGMSFPLSISMLLEPHKKTSRSGVGVVWLHSNVHGWAFFGGYLVEKLDSKPRRDGVVLFNRGVDYGYGGLLVI
ncbi:hypothetical protein QW180_30540 [Vibrio sinaloensis]|nr:hypothetical protein [Vibrio sinaloensis]